MTDDERVLRSLGDRARYMAADIRAALNLLPRGDLAGPFLRAAARSAQDVEAWLAEAADTLGAKPTQSIEMDESRDVVLSKCICSIRFESYATPQNPHAHGPLCPRFNLDLPNEGRR